MAFIFTQKALRNGGNPHPSDAGRLGHFTVEGNVLYVDGNLKKNHSNLFQC